MSRPSLPAPNLLRDRIIQSRSVRSQSEEKTSPDLPGCGHEGLLEVLHQFIDEHKMSPVIWVVDAVLEICETGNTLFE